MPSITSIQVGTPRTHSRDGAGNTLRQPWTTAIFKVPVTGPVWAGSLGLAGDGVFDTGCHGRPRNTLAALPGLMPEWRDELLEAAGVV